MTSLMQIFAGSSPPGGLIDCLITHEEVLSAVQSVLIVTSAVPGLIALSGRLAGEVDRQHPLILPVAPYGPVYLEHRPLGAGFLPSAHRLTLSGGQLLPDSLLGDEGLCAVVWPGGRIEVEILSASCPGPLDVSLRDGLRLARQGRHLLVEEDRVSAQCLLPPGARLPRRVACGPFLALQGDTEEGEAYLLLFSREADRSHGPLCLLRGHSIRCEEDGRVEVMVRLADPVGHARLETWQADAAGCRLVDSESLWADGSPHWPGTPEDTAVAALTAARLGLMDEARGYLLPTADCQAAFDRARQSQGAVLLPWPVPGGVPSVGLLRPEGDSLLSVEPVAFRAEASPGLQGDWRIAALQ